MDDFYRDLKVVLKILFVSILFGSFVITSIWSIQFYKQYKNARIEISNLYQTIDNLDNAIEEIKFDSDKKIKKLTKERDQYKKELKYIASQAVLNSCNDALSISADQGATIYECTPIS